VTSLAGAFAAPLAVEAQQPEKIYRIGSLLLVSPEEVKPWIQAFEKSLRDLGYVEGRNLVIEHRSAGGRPERLADIAGELVRLGVDVIVAGPNPAIAAAKQATATIPIVMVYGVDPVGTGFIASLRRPGGNITGGAWDPAPELYAKNLELLRTVIPKVSRVAVVWNPNFMGAGPYLKATEDAARQFSVALPLWSSPTPWRSCIAASFQSWPPSIDFPPSLRSESLRTRADSCLMAPTCPITGDAQPSTSTRSLKAPSLRPCRSNNRPSLIWSLISTPPGRSASRSRRRCWPGRIR
jgi:hypothetical protein